MIFHLNQNNHKTNTLQLVHAKSLNCQAIHLASLKQTLVNLLAFEELDATGILANSKPSIIYLQKVLCEA